MVGRWPWLARVSGRVWDEYDQLGDLQRIGLGVLIVLLLTSASLYCLGAASLVALRREPKPADAVPGALPVPTATVLLTAPDVDPISPLLADRTPTLRPTASPTPGPSTPRATVAAPGSGGVTVVRVATATSTIVTRP